MAGTSRNASRYRNSGSILAAVLLSGWAPGATTAPTLQEIQVAGRVLHFQEKPVSGPIVIAIVYNSADPRSHDEATALAMLLDGGVTVGNLVLQPQVVEQARLATTAGYTAIFATIGVDETLLAASLKQRQIPCLTRHLEQVEHGACIVAISSEPRVSIVVNETNATSAGVRFPTAFRMMVREI